MHKLVSGSFRSFLKDSSGATAIEYGLIVGLIGAAIIAGAMALGTSISHAFVTLAGDI